MNILTIIIKIFSIIDIFNELIIKVYFLNVFSGRLEPLQSSFMYHILQLSLLIFLFGGFLLCLFFKVLEGLTKLNQFLCTRIQDALLDPNDDLIHQFDLEFLDLILQRYAVIGFGGQPECYWTQIYDDDIILYHTIGEVITLLILGVELPQLTNIFEHLDGVLGLLYVPNNHLIACSLYIYE